MDPAPRTRLDARTVIDAWKSIKRMIESNFFKDGVPPKGITFHMADDPNHHILQIDGILDAEAADLYRTGSDYICFEPIPNGKKKRFFADIAFQEDACRFEKELFDLFWSQRAHNVAWSLWSE